MATPSSPPQGSNSLQLHTNYQTSPLLDAALELEMTPRGSTPLEPHAKHRTSQNLDAAIEEEMKNGGRKLDPNMDPKKFRRTISNRISARKSRLRSTKYAHDLEENVKDLEARISVLSLQMQSNEEKNKSAQLENDSLQQELENQSNESTIGEIQLEGKKDEIKRLKAEPEKDEVKNNASSSETPYYQSIEFYQIGLQKLQKNNPCPVVIQPAVIAPDHSINQQSGVINQIEPPAPMMVQPAVLAPDHSINQEFEDIEMYLNLDALNSVPFLDL